MSIFLEETWASGGGALALALPLGIAHKHLQANASSASPREETWAHFIAIASYTVQNLQVVGIWLYVV